MDINVIGSGSGGNAYIIREKDKSIMIDPGLPIKEIRKKAGLNLALLDACFISHEHGDHTKSINNIGKLGVPCAGSKGTMDNFPKLNGTRKILENKKEESVSGWGVIPFDTVHDSAEPFGYLFKTPEGKKVLYATDTHYIKYRFSGITHYIVECNYQEKYLAGNDNLLEKVKTRIRMSHMELETVKNFFRVQDLSKTEKIYLIHLSEENAHPKEIREEIESITGKGVITF